MHNLVRHTKEARYNRYTDAQMAFDLAEKSNMGFVELLPGWRVRVCKERDLWLSYSESNEEVKKDGEIVMRAQLVSPSPSTCAALRVALCAARRAAGKK